MSRSQELNSTKPIGMLQHSETWIQKICVALIAAILLAGVSTTGLMAADVRSGFDSIGVGDGPVAPEPVDVLCVAGTVINHEEQPLAGWTVRATYEGVNGGYPSQSTTTDANGRFRFDLPGTGRWAFEVVIPEGWEAVTPQRFAAYVTYGHTNCVAIRFKLRNLVQVIVYKIDDHHNPLAGWTIVATPGPNNRFATQQTAVTDDNGVATFYLTPGEWTFTEIAPADVTWWMPISPPTGAQTIIVRPDGPIEIRFKNLVVKERDSCIHVTKVDVPMHQGERPFGLAGWPIQVLRADGSIAAQGETDAFGEITFTGLPFGPYVVRELVLAGWEPVSPTAYNVFLTSRDEGCQQIRFENQQIPRGYCFIGRKIDAHQGVGLANWTIRATPLHPGGFTPDPVITDGQGRYRIDLPFEDYRIPNARYEVREEPQGGWTTVGPSSFVVTLPRFVDQCVELPDFVNRQVQNPGFGQRPPGPGDNVVVAVAAYKGACRATHIVRPNDSVSRIAGIYNASTHSVMSANPWINKHPKRWLFVGQQVCIP